MRLQLQKERLIAFVVHDLKNRVGAMDLHAQVVLRDRDLSPRAPASVHFIRDEARSLLRMVHNLLDISKSEEGRLAPQTGPVDLASQYGPVHWSLRSSLDNFSTVLAEGDTSQGLDYGHQRVLFDTPLRITTGNTIEFRLYADEGWCRVTSQAAPGRSTTSP